MHTSTPTASRQYLQPLLERTGALCTQPGVDRTRSGYYFDAALNYQDPDGCLDAPSRIPSGSIRALDLSGVTLARAHVLREDTQ